MDIARVTLQLFIIHLTKEHVCIHNIVNQANHFPLKSPFLFFASDPTMGGGGAMRTAAKIAGIGVGRTGFRGAPAAHPAEQSVRNASRPASAMVSSQGAKPAEMAPLHATAPYELDDWEFADAGDLVMAAGEPMPRMVFGGVPTLEEAKEATSELKEAIDKYIFSFFLFSF